MATNFGPSALATPANAVTAARLAATPLVAVMILHHTPSWLTCGAWLVLSGTDGVDGWLARRTGTTRSGAFLDPLADKVAVIAALVALVSLDVMWWVPVAAIAGRELGLVAYRSWLSRHGVSLPAVSLAKLKTVLQSLAVGAAVWPPTAGHRWLVLGILWAAVVLTIVTGMRYVLGGRRALA